MRVVKVCEKRLGGGTPHTSVGESMEIIRTLFMNDTTWAIMLKETGEVIGAMGYGPSCDCALPARDGEPICGPVPALFLF